MVSKGLVTSPCVHTWGLVTTLGGLWMAIVPFVVPTILGTSMNMSNSVSSMSHSMGASNSTAMFLGIAVSTSIYHIVPGGVVALYQLVLGFLRETQSVPTPMVEQEA